MKEGGNIDCQSSDSQDEVVERVKARLQEEGREARNLVAYSLPLQDPPQVESMVRHREVKHVAEIAPRRTSKQDKRPRSASAGRDPQASLRARHWGFLFRNLQQAVDEIYQTCEDDESIVECKEAIMMLERYSSDFQKLIEWLKLKWEYEHTPPPQRPTSLTWEIRTSSPGKALHPDRKVLTLNDVRRTLTFDSNAERPGVMNGSLQERKTSNKLQISKSDGLRGSEGNLGVPGIITPTKPLIIVHQAIIDKKHEESSRLEVERLKTKEIKLLENVVECENSEVSEVKKNGEEEEVQQLEMMDKKIERCKENGSKDEVCKDECEDKTVVSQECKQMISDIITNNESHKVNSENEVCVISSNDTCKEHDILVIDKCENSLGSSEEKGMNDNTTSSEYKPKDSKPLTCQMLPFNIEDNTSNPTKSLDSSTKPVETKVHESSKVCGEVGESKRSCAEVLQARSPAQKPGPTVYMNKASQVRQAYNQNKAPQKLSRSISVNSRQPLVPRSTDFKTSIIKHQGAGGKLTYRRVGEGKVTASPPTTRRQTMEAGRGSARHTLPHTMTRSHSSLGTTSRGLVRGCSSLRNSGSGKAYGSSSVVNVGMAGQERAASSSSLCSSTSSGQSWADKVRGVTTSLPSSHLSLQDEEGGWEVVRRGRRSHGGSTASLNNSNNPYHHHHNNNNNNNKNRSSKDTRSGSLNMDGHSCGDIKKRFHKPSSAMSMPSLIISKDSESSEVKGRKDNSATIRLNLETGKKPVMQTSSVPLPEPERKEGGISLTLDLMRQNSNVSKKLDSKRNRRNAKSAEELSKNGLSKESCVEECVTEEPDKNKCEANREKKTSDKSNPKHTERNIEGKCQNSEDEEDGWQEKATETFHFPPESQKTPPTSHLCDPAIPEISETSDGDEDDGRKSGVSEQETDNVLSVNSGVEVTESDRLHTEHDTKNYDSDSQNDDEKLLMNAAALESAVQEEQRLKQQIEETVKTEIKVEEEEEDCEEDCSEAYESVDRARSPLTLPYDSLLSSMSWADQVDAFESLEELRHPGRVLHIHEKLSSPSRKRSLSEKMRRHEERLAKAQELRENLIQAKTEKLKDLFKKIEEVRQDKEGLLVEKRDLFQRKMKLAEEKRRQYLQEIVNKAHDEENKAKEIAFINGLEAQNKLHDIMQQHQSHESRLADMAEERTRRQEEKAAKEVAAQERRRALEAERQARMDELCEKRRQRCERIDRQQAERREELLEQAREKARDREERLSALQQAQQAKETELVKKIQQKQEESARRHEENIEQIRQRALESTIMKYSRGCDEAPKLVRYETKKLCTLCNSLITSEVYLLSHLRGRRHQEALRILHQAEVVSSEDSETYNLRHIVDAPANIDDPQVTRDKERHKALKRRCRKIRSRMTTRGKEYSSAFKPSSVRESPNKVRISKALQQITKLVANQGSGPWPTADLTALDRPLLELIRILDKRERADQVVFSAQEGFTKLNSVLKVILDSTEQRPCILPAKSLGYSGRVLLGACHSNTDNCRHMLKSNLVGTLIDYLMHRLNELVVETAKVGSNCNINTIVNLPSDSASGALCEVVAEVVQVLCEGDLRGVATSSDTSNKEQADATWLRLQDLVSYCVSVGLVDKVWWYFGHVQGPLDSDTGVVEIILAAMRLVTALASTLAARRPSDDPTQLVGTLHVTDACGVVSLLYGLLLHQGGRSAMPTTPPRLSPTTQALTTAATTLLHNLASLDLNMFQSVLGSEGISLEFRHIASYLLWYCSHWPSDDILHNIIPLVGFFTVNNKENQAVVQSGEVPSVLQQLCNLPWQYFSETRLTSVLFPTLLACCLTNPDNMVILQQEMSFQVLEDFLHNSQAPDKPLLHILRRSNVQG